MNYAVKSMKIKSNWFNEYKGNKKNVYEKIGEYKGLYLYFTLFMFRIHNQQHEHTFITSISFLRNETGYTSQEIFDLLKLLQRAKVIKVTNITRWDQLITERVIRGKKGVLKRIEEQIDDEKILHIIATDIPELNIKETKDINDKIITVEEPKTEDDYYIVVSFEVFNEYVKYGLNERYFALYCLLNKWNNNTEKKSDMSIERMSNVLHYDKDYLHKLIIEMNRHYFLYSNRRRRKNKPGYFFEHHLGFNLKRIDFIKKEYKEKIDKFVGRFDKKKKITKKQFENAVPEVDESEEKIKKDEKLAFGTKKAQVKSSWGQNDPFANVPSDNYESPSSHEYDEIEELMS